MAMFNSFLFVYQYFMVYKPTNTTGGLSCRGFPVNDSRGKALQSSSAASPCQDVGNLQDPSGWWFFATPLINMKVSWDDDPNIWKNKKHIFPLHK